MTIWSDVFLFFSFLFFLTKIIKGQKNKILTTFSLAMAFNTWKKDVLASSNIIKMSIKNVLRILN